MAAQRIEENVVTRGDRFEMVVTLLNSDKTAFDLTAANLEPRMELRRSASSETVAVEFSASVSGAGNNVVSLTLPATQTLLLQTGVQYYGRLLLQHTTDPDFDQITKTHYHFIVEDSATKR